MKKATNPLVSTLPEKHIHLYEAEWHLKSVAGRVLNIVDIAFPPGPQNDAVKISMRKEFREEQRRMHKKLGFNSVSVDLFVNADTKPPVEETCVQTDVSSVSYSALTE